jgi:putative transposase
MQFYEQGSHTKYSIKLHFVWITKYRYKALTGAIAERARELIRQVCQRNQVEILKGHMEPDHVHLFVSIPTDISASKLMQYIKGSTSRKLQQEFAEIRKRYWGRHLWASGYFCVSAGNITDEMIKEYIEHHRDSPSDDFTITNERNPS